MREGLRTTCDCTLSVLCHIPLCMRVTVNSGDMWLEQGLNCRLLSGCLTRLGPSSRLRLGHGVWAGVRDRLWDPHAHRVVTGLQNKFGDRGGPLRVFFGVQSRGSIGGLLVQTGCVLYILGGLFGTFWGGGGVRMGFFFWYNKGGFLVQSRVFLVFTTRDSLPLLKTCHKKTVAQQRPHAGGGVQVPYPRVLAVCRPAHKLRHHLVHAAKNGRAKSPAHTRPPKGRSERQRPSGAPPSSVPATRWRCARPTALRRTWARSPSGRRVPRSRWPGEAGSARPTNAS